MLWLSMIPNKSLEPEGPEKQSQKPKKQYKL